MGSLKVWDGSVWQTVANQGRPGSNVFVGPSTPPGTPTSGDMWYDTDEVSGITLPMTLANGGTGGTSAATARSSLTVPAVGNSAVTAGAPTTGTWARGDQWVDSGNVLWVCTVAGSPGSWTSANSGEELAYNQLTTNLSVTQSAGGQIEVVGGTTRTYDGSPIMVEFYCGAVQTNANVQLIIDLWDGPTDLGYIGASQSSGGGLGVPFYASRRLVPTAGTHTFRAGGWSSTGAACTLTAGAGGAVGTWTPAYVRVRRA